MRVYSLFLGFILFFGSSFCFAHDAIPKDEISKLMRPGSSGKSDMDLAPEINAIIQSARNRGVEFSVEQIGYLGDILMAYHDGETDRRGTKRPNIIWLHPTDADRADMTEVLKAIIQYFDPSRPVEHMHTEQYLGLEPELFNTKLKEQGHRFAIMDDWLKFLSPRAEGEITSADVDDEKRAADYLDAMINTPIRKMTFFVLDQDGVVLSGLNPEALEFVTIVLPERYLRTVCEKSLNLDRNKHN